MSSAEAPQLIFGCGGLGNEFLRVDAMTDLLQTLKKGGVGRLDTAGLYPPTDIGASQRLLGQSGASQMGFAIDTKILISIRGLQDTLTPDKIEKSVAISYQDLNLKDGQCINTLYAHAPDVATPLEDQARGFDAQYRKGLFKKVNYLSLSSSTKKWSHEYQTDCSCSSDSVTSRLICSPSTSPYASATGMSSPACTKASTTSSTADTRGPCSI